MKPITYDIEHFYQPTNSACGESAISSLLSYYDHKLTPEELLTHVPQIKNEQGEPAGSITAKLVTWCQQQGFDMTMYSSDCLILDLSWKSLSADKIAERLATVRNEREVPGLGKHWAQQYVDAYIEMLESGANLKVVPYITSKLLNDLLEKGPVFANICSTVLKGKGRTQHIGLRESEVDDIRGRVLTHSVVIYGRDEADNFLVADPWQGLSVIDPETMVIVIAAAQIECDNQLVVIDR